MGGSIAITGITRLWWQCMLLYPGWRPRKLADSMGVGLSNMLTSLRAIHGFVALKTLWCWARWVDPTIPTRRWLLARIVSVAGRMCQKIHQRERLPIGMSTILSLGMRESTTRMLRQPRQVDCSARESTETVGISWRSTYGPEVRLSLSGLTIQR